VGGWLRPALLWLLAGILVRASTMCKRWWLQSSVCLAGLRSTANPWLVGLLVLGSTSSVRTGCVCILDLAGCGSLFVLQAQCERSPLLMTFTPCSAFIPFNAFAPCSAFIPFNAGLGVFFSPAGTSGCPHRWTPGTLRLAKLGAPSLRLHGEVHLPVVGFQSSAPIRNRLDSLVLTNVSVTPAD